MFKNFVKQIHQGIWKGSLVILSLLGGFGLVYGQTFDEPINLYEHLTQMNGENDNQEVLGKRSYKENDLNIIVDVNSHKVELTFPRALYNCGGCK